jgi:leader peptidase (prepilin peptidase) / N-methyltransferase
MWYVATMGAILGSITASFLCVVAERVPRGLSIGGRSKCVCGRQLLIRENLPVIGWLVARGQARCCGAKIPMVYFGAEVVLGAAWAAAAVIGGVAGVVVAACAAGVVLFGTGHLLRQEAR